MEPFRAPLVDRLTLRLVNERTLKAEDFGTRVAGTGAGSVILMPESLPRYLAEYEKAVATPGVRAPGGMRAAWEAQVESLTCMLRDGGEFEPYREEN
jgi:CRISPR/Cas system-associated endonuclease Cas1